MSGLPAEQRAELKGMIEAMIFSSDSPVAVKTLKDIFEASEFDGRRIEVQAEEIGGIVEELKRDYADAQRSYTIIEIAGGYQYATLPKFSSWVGKVFKEKAKRRLSQSAIESLAIIAYKQPVTKPDLEFIRGVDCDYVLKTLLERNLVAIVGRASTPGRPLLYGTTQDFLRHFGLNALSDLPKPREIEELLGETELEVEKRLLEEQQQNGEDDESAPKKEKDEGPRFRKPIIPKKKEEPVVQLPLPMPQEPPADIVQGGDGEPAAEGAEVTQPAPPTETAEPVDRSDQTDRSDQPGQPEQSDQPGTAPEEPATITPAAEVANEILQEDTMEALADEIRPAEDEDREPPQESMTWEQIPEDRGEAQEQPRTDVEQPSIEELHASVEQVHERGWTKFKHRVQGLLKRLFG